MSTVSTVNVHDLDVATEIHAYEGGGIYWLKLGPVAIFAGTSIEELRAMSSAIVKAVTDLDAETFYTRIGMR